MNLDLDAHLLSALFREEWRLHKSLSGTFGSALFPLTIFALSALIRVISPSLSSSAGPLALHLAAVLYGVFVGGFGALGESIMTRRLGQVSMILQLPRIQPISLRRVMALFYVKDAIFYLIYTFVPLVLGWGIASRYVFEWVLGMSLFGAFLIGMGLSFLISASPPKSKLFLLTALLILVASSHLGWIEPRFLLPQLGYYEDGQLTWFALGGMLAVLLAASGVLMMRDRYEVHESKYSESFLRLEKRFSTLKNHSPLAAKEWIELVRSKSLGAAVGGYALHLAGLYAVTWVLQSGFGAPLSFNLVFYGGFTGFMGVLTYSFLTGIEQNDYLDALPVTVDHLVKAKIAVYFIVTSGIGFCFVVMIGVIRGELSLIPAGLVVATCMSIYIVAITSYLTGLWTNTMFFGAGTMSKFALLVVPPMMVIEVGALILPMNGALGTSLIGGVSLISLIASLFFLRKLSERWSGRSFSAAAAR